MDFIVTISTILFLLFSLFLNASPIDGRKDPGQYWTQVMMGQPMPESIKIFMQEHFNNVGNDNEVINLEDIKVKSQDKYYKFNKRRQFDLASTKPFAEGLRPSSVTSQRKNSKPAARESFVKDFDPIPNLSLYHNDVTNHQIDSTLKKSFAEYFVRKPLVTSDPIDGKSLQGKSFITDFDPIPNLSVYHDDVTEHQTDSTLKKLFAEDFERKPLVTSDPIDTKSLQGKSFITDFDPIPNLSVYHDDATYHQTDSTPNKSFPEDCELKPLVASDPTYTKSLQGKSFIKDFDPIPNLSVYHDDDINSQMNSMSKKSFAKKFEQIPSITSSLDDTNSLQGKSFIKDFDPVPNLSIYHDNAIDHQVN